MSDKQQNSTFQDEKMAQLPAEKSNATRRLFIKNSALALPAVMTLHSGRAVAQMSALPTCDLEMTFMGQMAGDSSGIPFYFRVTRDSNSGKITQLERVPHDMNDPFTAPAGTQTVTPSCYMSAMDAGAIV